MGDLDRLRPRGSFDDALDVIATVLTYFDIAYSRMIDFVPMLVQHQFLIGFSVELRNTLHQKLELIGDKCLDKCNEYAVDDPLIELSKEGS